jgi:hypothetical protein
MTTPKNRPCGARSFVLHAALALGALLAVGCATPKPVYKDSRAGPISFTIGYDPADPKQCPRSAEPDFKNCNPNLRPNDPGQPQGCARATPTQSVVFGSKSGKDFELQFDPFGKSSIASSRGTTGVLPFITARKTTSLTYTFRVKAEGCEPLDPEIIVDW